MPGQPTHRLARVFVQLRHLSQRDVIFDAALGGAVQGEGKSVREYLVHDAALEPVRCFEVPVVHRKPEAAGAGAAHRAVKTGGVVAKPLHALVGVQTEAVPQGFRLVLYSYVNRKDPPCLSHGIFFFPVIAENHTRGGGDAAACVQHGKAQGIAGFHRAGRGAVLGFPGVVESKGAHGQGRVQNVYEMGGAGLKFT